MKQLEIERFWHFCTEHGVTSKRLLLQPRTSLVTPLTVVAGEAIRYGSPVITVPYSAVINAQTVQGERQTASLPSYSQMMRFLTRHSRMSRMSAEQVWLAAYVTQYKALIAARARHDAAPPPLTPLFASSLQPDLPCLFRAENAEECPALGSQPQPVLDEWHASVKRQLGVACAMMEFYHKRRVHRRGTPATSMRLSEVEATYWTVMQRALLIPLNCELSTPLSLPEFLEASPDCPLLPSFVPVIDAIRAAKGEEQENCLLYTCAKSDFVSPSTRRRVMMETSPLSSRRVVAVATRDIKEGDELLLGVQW